jgi:iron complex outermembrane receptor protein
LSFLSDKADGYFEHSGARLASIQDYVGGGFPAKAKVTDADDFRGIDSENVRAQIDFDLNDATTLGFTFNYGTVDNVGNAYDTVPSPDGVVDLSATDFWGSPFDPKKLSEAPNLRGFVDKKALSYTGDLNYEQDDWSLTAIVNYSTAKKSYLEDDDGGPNNIALFGTDQDADTFSAEIRANGESGRLTWTTGLYYLLIDGDYFGTFQFPGITGASGPTTVDGYGYGYDLDYGLKTEAFAAFAQAEYELSRPTRWPATTTCS